MAANEALLASLLLGQRQKPDPLDIYRKFGQQQLAAGSSTAPLGSGNPLEGIARALQGGLGGIATGLAAQRQEEQDSALNSGLAKASTAKTPEEIAAALQGLKGSDVNAVLGQIVQGRLDQLITQQQAGAKLPMYGGGPATASAPPAAGPIPQGGGAAPTGGIPQPGYGASSAPGSVNAQAIGGIESGGQPNGGYAAVGPPANAQGHRAYGKYQVLETNIGPWTQEILGKAMTPQEFAASPEAQDKVFEAKFGEYVTKYGSPQAASRAWFAGEGGMNNPGAKDVNGTTVAGYENKFNQGVGQAAPGSPGPVAAPPAQGSGTTAMNQPGPPTAMSSPAGDQLRQRAQQAQQAGDNVTALKFHQEAIQEDAKWATEVGKQNLGQPQQNIQNEAKAREQFDQLQSVKDYRKAATVFRSAVDAAKTNTAAADLNMVYAFATLMDPGSVVRDSETGMVTATQNATERVKALVASVTGGSRLSPESKAALVNEMGSRYESYKTAHDDLANTFKGISTRSQMNPDNVVVPYPSVDWKATGGGGAGGPPPPPPGFRPLP